MNLDELDLEFDIYYNNISSNQAPGLTKLEKSILLTEAQELVVKELYSGSSGGFETSEEITESLNSLVKTATLTAETDGTYKIPDGTFPSGTPIPAVWFIVYEELKHTPTPGIDKILLVTPVTHDNLYEMKNNPFKGPESGNRVLRVTSGDRIELIGKPSSGSSTYKIKYLTKPEPIVLKGVGANAPQPYSDYPVDGNPIKLPESVHRTILLKAAQLAKTLWAS